jgi:hypothetical protein
VPERWVPPSARRPSLCLPPGTCKFSESAPEMIDSGAAGLVRYAMMNGAGIQPCRLPVFAANTAEKKEK